MKLKDMPPLHQYMTGGTVIPMSTTATTVVPMPTDEQVQRLFALHAASQVFPGKSMAEICQAAEFIETGHVVDAEIFDE